MFAIPVHYYMFIGLPDKFNCSQHKNEDTEDTHLTQMECKGPPLFSEQKQLKNGGNVLETV